MQAAQNIFRAYDIRGIYPTDLNEKTALHVGKAVGTLAKRREEPDSKAPPKIVVGMDDRESSPSLTKKLIKGLTSTGCNVTDVGVTLTPIIHFLTVTQGFDVGINVTASHNPKEFNGFRLDFAHALPFSFEDIKCVREMVLNEDYVTGFGTVKRADLLYLYIESLKKRFSFKRKFKVVLDCGNGASSIIAPRVFEELGCRIVPVSCVFNSNFPYGVPDPENPLFMKGLRKKVFEHAGDVGFAFDTDGDRAGVVDEKGNIYSTDRVLALLAEDVLKKNQGETVVYDVKSSGFLSDWIKHLGGVPKMIKTGHTHFMEALRKGAILGGEYSGHIYFGDKYFGFDDGIYAVLRVLKIMEDEDKSVARLMAKHPKRFNSPEIKLNCTDEKKFSIVDQVVKLVRDSKEYMGVSTIDGARVQVTETGWFLIRASNTTPRLSIRVEGIDEEERDLMLKNVKEILDDFAFLDLSPLS